MRFRLQSVLCRVGFFVPRTGPFRLRGCALRVERTALRRGDSGGLSSRGVRESRKIEKPRVASGLFYFRRRYVCLPNPLGALFPPVDGLASQEAYGQRPTNA